MYNAATLPTPNQYNRPYTVNNGQLAHVYTVGSSFHNKAILLGKENVTWKLRSVVRSC